MPHFGQATIDLRTAPPRVYFLYFEEEIAAEVRAGYKLKGIWRQFRNAEIPFPGSYPTFFRYCMRYGIAQKKRAAAPIPREAQRVRWVQKYGRKFYGPTE